MKSLVTFFYEPLHMDVLVLTDQQELTSALCRHWMLFGGPAIKYSLFWFGRLCKQNLSFLSASLHIHVSIDD